MFYNLSLLPIAFICVPLKEWIIDGDSLIKWGNNIIYTWFLIISIILAVIQISIKTPCLKFSVIETKLTKDEQEKMIRELLEWQGWFIEVFEKDIVIFDTSHYIDHTLEPPMKMYYPGEKVTIVLDHGRILINSMPDIFSRMQTYSKFRNQDNIDLISEEVRIEEKELGKL